MKFLCALAALVGSASASCPSGTSNLKITVNRQSGTGLEQYNTGIEAAIRTLEWAYCTRNSRAHVISLKGEHMNNGGSSTTGGVADTPSCNRYSRGSQYSVTLDTSRTEEQGMAWSIMLHEVTHTLATPHTGNAFMLSGQIPSYQYIDSPVAAKLRCADVVFNNEIQSAVSGRGRFDWTNGVQAAYGKSYSDLQRIGRGGSGGGGSRPSPPSPTSRNPSPTSRNPSPTWASPTYRSPSSGSGGRVSCGSGDFAPTCGECRWCSGDCGRFSGICKPVNGGSSSGGGSSGTACRGRDPRFTQWCQSVGCSNSQYCVSGSGWGKVSAENCAAESIAADNQDNWETLAKLHDTTVESLKASNPDLKLNDEGFLPKGPLSVCTPAVVDESGAAQASGAFALGLALFVAVFSS